MSAQLACLLEATARKPGNVHRFRDFDDAHYLDFVVSASALDRLLTPERYRRLGLGPLIAEAVADSIRRVGHNTNLGMILLLAPLASIEDDSADLRGALARILERTTIDDARAVFAAIRLARPGGLGSTGEQDVAGEPTVSLREAMRLASDRDAIARQYVTAFEDVFEIGVPTLRGEIRVGRPLETAILRAHLTLMAQRPDTLIGRKCGPEIAAESSRRAAAVLDSGWPDRPSSGDELRRLDDWLRADGHSRNPGATADLIAACLFVALREGTIEFPKHVNRSGWECVSLSRS
ncbi:triphosphoribosyl-dephospho-CoA synthase [Tautonia sociabilis]|nr:triphosphoribosyl-dephospho-CoA synthase [Tautonia sociabilis]